MSDSIKVFQSNSTTATKPNDAIKVWIDNIDEITGGGGGADSGVNSYVHNNSATINSVNNAVISNSANWNNVYNTVVANSASWGGSPTPPGPTPVVTSELEAISGFAYEYYADSMFVQDPIEMVFKHYNNNGSEIGLQQEIMSADLYGHSSTITSTAYWSATDTPNVYYFSAMLNPGYRLYSYGGDIQLSEITAIYNGISSTNLNTKFAGNTTATFYTNGYNSQWTAFGYPINDPHPTMISSWNNNPETTVIFSADISQYTSVWLEHVGGNYVHLYTTFKN